MTSTATFLVNLASGTSQSQSAAPANASSGEDGHFAMLLETSGAASGRIEGITTPLDPFGPLTAAADGQTPLETASSDAALHQALTEGLGLPRGGAGIDAAIIENPVNAAPENLLPVDGDSDNPEIILLPVDGDSDNPEIIDDNSLLSTSAGSPASTGAAQSGTVPGVSLPPAAQPETTNPESMAAQEAFTRPDQALMASPRTPQQNAAPESAAGLETGPQNNGRAADGPEAPRATGLENALNQASRMGRDNGLEAVLSRAAQLPSRGEAPPSGLTQGDDTASAKRAAPFGVATDQDPSTVKPETGRAEFAPRGGKIFQQLIKPGSGQTLVQFTQNTGGETNGVSSPPMLTVSVQAQAASPGPASATAPHVPVSALAVHIAQQANNGARRFTIRLDPPELGRIEVRLDISRDGQIMTHLVVERSETLELLQRDARHLERALQDAGLDTSGEGMKFSLKDQGLARGDEQHGGGEDDFGTSTNGGGDDPGDTMPPATRYIASTGLDIRI